MAPTSGSGIYTPCPICGGDADHHDPDIHYRHNDCVARALFNHAAHFRSVIDGSLGCEWDETAYQNVWRELAAIALTVTAHEGMQ